MVGTLPSSLRHRVWYHIAGKNLPVSTHASRNSLSTAAIRWSLRKRVWYHRAADLQATLRTRIGKEDTCRHADLPRSAARGVCDRDVALPPVAPQPTGSASDVRTDVARSMPR